MLLLKIARSLLLCSHKHLLITRAVYIPGVQNCAVGLMFPVGPSHNEWKLSTALVQMLWNKFGKAEVDFIASQDNAQYLTGD